MKIGIIGSNGFIGNNLYSHLLDSKKFKVYKFSSYSKYKINWINQVSKEIKKIKPNIIINCAASQILNDDKKSIKHLIESNLYSNIIFLQEATKNNLFKGYISFGTKWEFDKNRSFNPLNFYAATKHANDIFFKYFSIKKDIITISLKIFDTYGPKDKRKKIINLLLNSYNKNKTLKITPGNQYLDLVHVNDISKLIFKICNDIKKKKLKGFNYYTVSSKKPIKLKNLVKLIKSSVKRELKVKIGAKKYRSNQAMNLIKNIKNYPSWKPKLNLVKEISRIFDNIK